MTEATTAPAWTGGWMNSRRTAQHWLRNNEGYGGRQEQVLGHPHRGWTYQVRRPDGVHCSGAYASLEAAKARAEAVQRSDTPWPHRLALPPAPRDRTDPARVICSCGWECVGPPDYRAVELLWAAHVGAVEGPQ